MKADEKVVERIHSKAIVLDAHLDLPYALYEDHKRGKYNVLREKYLKNFLDGGVNVIVCAIYVDSLYLPEGAQREALGQIAAFYEEVERCPELRACFTYGDIENAIGDGKIALILSFEGAEPIGSNIELLNVYYKLGVRGLGVAWARRNLAADGASFGDEERGQSGGLTAFGFELVKKADSIGMFLDVAHLNDEGVQDVFSLVNKPVIASHANCRTLRKTPRNMSDEQIKALAAKGGVIGMNVCSAIIAPTPEETTISSFADHFVHVARLVGSDHVGLGFDFYEGFAFEMPRIVIDGREHSIFNVVKGYPGMRDLTRALLLKGFTEQDILKIYGGNFMRVFKALL